MATVVHEVKVGSSVSLVGGVWAERWSWTCSCGEVDAGFLTRQGAETMAKHHEERAGAGGIAEMEAVSRSVLRPEQAEQPVDHRRVDGSEEVDGPLGRYRRRVVACACGWSIAEYNDLDGMAYGKHVAEVLKAAGVYADEGRAGSGAAPGARVPSDQMTPEEVAVWCRVPVPAPKVQGSTSGKSGPMSRREEILAGELRALESAEACAGPESVGGYKSLSCSRCNAAVPLDGRTVVEAFRRHQGTQMHAVSVADEAALEKAAPERRYTKGDFVCELCFRTAMFSVKGAPAGWDFMLQSYVCDSCARHARLSGVSLGDVKGGSWSEGRSDPREAPAAMPRTGLLVKLLLHPQMDEVLVNPARVVRLFADGSESTCIESDAGNSVVVGTPAEVAERLGFEVR